MATFSTVTKAANPDGVRKPPRKVVLEPDAFADTWPEKPREAVAIGIRLIASSDVQAAKGQASEQVKAWYRDRQDGTLTDEQSAVDAYNDSFMRHCVARAACDVNDITRAYFPRAEDTVRDALTEEAVRRLWDEILILHASTSVGIPRADGDDVMFVGRVLVDGAALASLPDSEQTELRTLLGYIRVRLAGTGKAREAPVGTDGDGGYVVRSARE